MSSGTKSRLKSLAFFVLLVAFVACEGKRSPFGCGGLDEVLGLVVEDPRITVTPITPSTERVPGTSLQVPVVARFVGGPTRATLSLDKNLPSGFTATFSPSTVTDSTTSIMTLVADSSATPIIFVDQIVAAEAGTSFEVVGRAAMTGEVELPFALVTPGSQVATVGTTREMTIGVSRQPTFPTGTPTVAAVQIGRTNGFAGAVSVVAITDRPGDYQVSFSLSSTTFSGIGMTIMANSGVTTGPHVILLRGTSGLIVHEVSMTVDVTAAPTTPYPHYPFAIKRPPE